MNRHHIFFIVGLIICNTHLSATETPLTKIANYDDEIDQMALCIDLFLLPEISKEIANIMLILPEIGAAVKDLHQYVMQQYCATNTDAEIVWQFHPAQLRLIHKVHQYGLSKTIVPCTADSACHTIYCSFSPVNQSNYVQQWIEQHIKIPNKHKNKLPTTCHQHISDYYEHNRSHQHATVRDFAGIIIPHIRTDFLIKRIYNHNSMYIGGSYSPNIMLMDIPSGTITARLQGHTKLIRCCVPTYNGQHLISASTDETIKIWNTQTHTLVTTIDTMYYDDMKDIVLCLAQEGRYFCSSSLREVVKIWDIATGKAIRTMCKIQPSDDQYFDAWSLMMHDLLVYMGSGAGNLHIVDPRTAEHKMTSLIKAHHKRITCMVPSQLHDMHFYSGSHDGTIKKWDMRVLKDPIELKKQDYGVACLYENGNNNTLISGGADGVRIWCASGHEASPLATFKNQALRHTESITMNFEKTHLYVASGSDGIKILDFMHN